MNVSTWESMGGDVVRDVERGWRGDRRERLRETGSGSG